MSWWRAPLWGPWPDFTFSFLCRTIALLFFLERPLLREVESVICSAIFQWSELRRTHNHALLSHLRLLGSLSVASNDSQGLRWKYSYRPPHGDKGLQSESKSFYGWQSVSLSWRRALFVDVWPDIASFSVWNLLLCLCGAPSLTRGRVCPL
jgi:hypothetical protein